MLRTLCRGGGAVFKHAVPRLCMTLTQQRWASRLPMNTVVLFVPQQEAWVVERMGRFHRMLEPGLNFLIPILDQIRYVQSLKEIVIDIPEQSAVTLDNVTLQIDGVLYLKILDPYKASYGVEDPEYAVTQLAQTTMRSELGKLTLDKVFRERESLNSNIVHSINQASDEWGIRCLNLSSCQLMELSPPRMDRTVVMVTFVNHTSCECLSKRPLHSIIRRAATDHLCSPPELPCASGALWDPVNCVCVSTEAINYSERETEGLDSGLLALCGPNRVLHESTCECVCRNGLTEDSCDPGWKLDHNTCECQCEGQGEGKWCPTGQRWDEELCGCVCAAECPGNQPLNPDTCLCQCRESPQSCLRQGKRFNPNSCSCYRLPCRKPRRVCQAGFYYSHQVCQCIPNYMRPEWN